MYTGWPSSIPNLFARDTLHPLLDNPERVQALSDVPSWDLPFPYHMHQPSELLAQPSSLHLPLSPWSLLDCSVNVTINSSGLVRRNLPVTYSFLSLIVTDCDLLLTTWKQHPECWCWNFWWVSRSRCGKVDMWVLSFLFFSDGNCTSCTQNTYCITESHIHPCPDFPSSASSVAFL